MRLSKIKLAGFKSFVDPTAIHFLSNLTAVAGPNGCGKSNVIDAVRWVMGESSAKHLRGGALTDVIFSGSSARKPVGQATVELLFDNTSGKIGGEYASYAEIAIKRQVTRDGQSNYFLNGQRCRRRDITDIFLGTGLGPRSYAIIEQGMISRVIDAKPEELRTFIEEAAGVSKYKERRKETENRIQHTQDNLARLNDLRGELDNQLRHLQRQSQAAEKYKTLKAEETTLSTQLAALVWNRLDVEIKENEAKIRELITKLEEEQAKTQHLKTQQEKLRIDQTESNEALNEVQKRYYGVGGEIAKIEQAIQHHQERQQQLILDKQEAEQTLLSAQSQLEQDQANMLGLQQLIEELEPDHMLSTELAEQAIESQQQAEIALEEWREKTAQLQQAGIGPSRQAESEKAKITQLEKQIHQTQERINRLEAEIREQPANETTEIDVIDEKLSLGQHEIENIEEQIQACVSQKEFVLTTVNALRAEIKHLQQALNEMQGQQAALAALQSSALGKDDGAKKAWLSDQRLDENSYLAQRIEVTQGWEIAVETVLEGFLEAVGVEHGQLSSLTSQLQSLKGCGISLIEWQSSAANLLSVKNRLINCVKGAQVLPASIYHLLANVHVCTSIEEATAILPSLTQGESLITPDGVWMGLGWVKVKVKPQENTVGILAREEKLKTLNQEIAIQQERLSSSQQSIEEAEEKLKDIEFEKETFNHEKSRLHQDLITLQSERKIKQNRIEQSQKRFQQIQQDLSECRSLIQQSQQEVHTARSSLHQALEQMSQVNEEQEALALAKTHLQEQVAFARIKVKETAAKAQETALKLQTYRTQHNALKDNLNRCHTQIENAQARVQNIVLAMAKNEDPIESLRHELENYLESRIIIEGDLNQARDAVAAVDNQLREIEHQLQAFEQKSIHVREQLEQTKMHWQALQVRCESALEKLKNVEQSVESILATMPEEANESAWQQNIQEIEQKINRLGAINLAAIDEYQAALQRKEYLDSQCNDLTEALTTLENAIKKIDKETKTKFKETFDKVNNEFTQLFPRLFGGGQAILSMTGEDLLDTGISLMARPPGKKNSTIQQLSGGEKALTAVALVFSIFQLNPAPFCMLDEVDAPLDDNNVGRFCDLVKHMSKTVQFIYVSHNKLAIEMAEQLQGVTMREPGVSRLVTVDIEEAKSMAQA